MSTSDRVDRKMTINDSNEPIMEASNLEKLFSVKRGFTSTVLGETEKKVHAVDGVDLKIKDGEIHGLVGESGCGKSTLGRLLIRLLEPTDGTITFRGTDITHLSRRELKEFRREMQMIFQDPSSSLPARLTVHEILAEPLRIHDLVSSTEESRDRASKLLEEVDMVPTENFIDKHPNELSGGQRQRVCIARAITLKPKFIVADEPVSMLDLSVRAGILNLIKELKEEYGLTVLLITHDLASAQYMSTNISVMYVGKIVEVGKGSEILKAPYHPYAKVLKAALPTLDPRTKAYLSKLPAEEAEIADPINVPSGCRFHPRCIYARDICKDEIPPLVEYNSRKSACHALGDWIEIPD